MYGWVQGEMVNSDPAPYELLSQAVKFSSRACVTRLSSVLRVLALQDRLKSYYLSSTNMYTHPCAIDAFWTAGNVKRQMSNQYCRRNRPDARSPGQMTLRHSMFCKKPIRNTCICAFERSGSRLCMCAFANMIDHPTS